MIAAMLANVDAVTRLESATKTTKMVLGDTLIVFVAAGVISGAIAMWMIFRRTRRKRVTGGEKVYRSNPSSADEDAQADEVRRRYKRRVRRRDHRARNPTLADTGGLPPARSGHESDPS